MGTDSQKENLVAGRPALASRARFKQIWAEKHPDVSLNRVNKDFHAKYGIGLFALCEIWHSLRSTNQTFALVIQAFAEKCDRINKEKHNLELVIARQKAELRKHQTYTGIPRSAVEAEIMQQREHQKADKERRSQ